MWLHLLCPQYRWVEPPQCSCSCLWSSMYMTMSLQQWRVNFTGCVFRSESISSWVLWCTKLFTDKDQHIWGNYAFRWATTSTYPVIGLQTEGICSSRELTRRHMASVLLALALPLGTLLRSWSVNRKPWLFLNRDWRLIYFISRIRKTDFLFVDRL